MFTEELRAEFWDRHALSIMYVLLQCKEVYSYFFIFLDIMQLTKLLMC